MLLLKAMLSLKFFPQYATLFLEIQMRVLFPLSKTKSITLHNLLIMRSVVYNVPKSYVAVALAFFFLFMMLIF